MVAKRSKAIDRDGLIAAIRKTVKAGGGKPLSIAKFVSESKLPRHSVRKHFARWKDALKEAGFTFKMANAPLTSEQMLEDWGRVARKLGRRPPTGDYGVHGKHSLTTISRRFGSWRKVPQAFREFAARLPQWADVLALLPSKDAPDQVRLRKMRQAQRARPRREKIRDCRLPDRPVCGPPLDFAGLRHAPTNELGVVLLFGAMARSMGFLIESLQSRFPDCEAKRLTAPESWQSVLIEFEYESRNYRDHCHAADGCDIIVCWRHNWEECPENIDVIALSDHVARVAAERAGNN